MKGLFITGTGTGVGKTHVTGLLLGLLRQRDVDALSIKPIQTGCAADEESPDLLEHWGLANWRPAPEIAAQCCPVKLAFPASPHLAAARERLQLKSIQTIEYIHKSSILCDFLLVEGAGGLLVPINQQETMLDLMAALNLPILLVAAAGLGTINHTLLTVRELQRAKLAIQAIVLSVHPGEEGELLDSNRETIARWTGLPVLTHHDLPQLADQLKAAL